MEIDKLKTLHRELTDRFQRNPSKELVLELMDLNKKILKILEGKDDD